MSPPPAKRQKLFTELAEKYGHPQGASHQPIAGILPLKSGITPLNLGPFRTREEAKNYQALEAYQRRRFNGFTAAELHAVEALAPLIKDELNVQLYGTPIHPMYEKKRWDPPLPRHIAKIPLGKGRHGYWEVSNPVVWKAMLPALQLVSLFLSNTNSWPWWDALLNGRFEKIEDHEMLPQFGGHNFARFEQRPLLELQLPEARESVQKAFQDLANNMDIQFISGHTEDRTGLPPETPEVGDFVYGNTSPSHVVFEERIRMRLSVEMIEPLLTPNITSAERSLDLFRMAATILHESAHALWFKKLEKFPLLRCLEAEPFYEGENISELGFSLENSIFGGLAETLLRPGMPGLEKGLSCGAIIQIIWNRANHIRFSASAPILLPLPPDFGNHDFAPIPVAYFTKLYQPEFWSAYVRRFGGRSTHMGPKTIIYRKTVENGQFTGRPLFHNYDLTDWDEIPIDPATMSASTALAIESENTRRQQACRITYRIEQYIYNHRAAETAQANIQYVQAGQQPISRTILLNTMTFAIPENLLLSYILDRGGLPITPDEWHHFLLLCNHDNQLFRYSEDGRGVVTRIDAGWPTTPLKSYPRPLVAEPSKAIMSCFRVVCGEVMRDGCVFKDKFRDHDMEEFRKRCNKYYRKHPRLHVKTVLGKKVEDFGDRLFDACVYQCYKNQDMFTYGPEGILRKLPGGPVVKRNEDKTIVDKCNPM